MLRYALLRYAYHITSRVLFFLLGSLALLADLQQDMVPVYLFVATAFFALALDAIDSQLEFEHAARVIIETYRRQRKDEAE